MAFPVKYYWSTDKLWSYSDGEKYFKYFEENSIIFLDLPGARLTQDLVNRKEDLAKVLAMSSAVHEYFRTEIGDPPSRNSNDYVVDPRDKHINHVISSSRRFVKEIKRGDIVVVSPRRQYDKILFGVVVDDFDPRSTVIINPYIQDPFNTRKVEWISSNASKRDLSDDLAMRLENRNTIVDLGGEYKNEVLAAAYKNYVTSSVSKIDVDCPRYQGKSPLETLEVQEMISFFSALYYAQINSSLDLLRNKSFSDIARNYYESDLISNIENDFHSPGKYVVHATTVTLGIFLSACIAMAAVGRFDNDTANTLNVINTQAGGSEEINAETLNMIQSTVNSISQETLHQCNAAGLIATENLGVKTSCKINE